MNFPLPPESAEIPRVIVVAGVIVRGGKILVVKNIKKEPRIEPPGGKWERDKDPTLEEAVVRELGEEVQVAVAVREFVGAHETDSKEADIVVHHFLCELVSGEPRVAESEYGKLDPECLWLTPDELEARTDLTKSLRSALPALRAIIARGA